MACTSYITRIAHFSFLPSPSPVLRLCFLCFFWWCCLEWSYDDWSYSSHLVIKRERAEKVTAFVFWDRKTNPSSHLTPDFLFCETEESSLLWCVLSITFSCSFWLIAFYIVSLNNTFNSPVNSYKFFFINFFSAKNSPLSGRHKLLNPHTNLKYILFHGTYWILSLVIPLFLTSHYYFAVLISSICCYVTL